MRALRLAGLFVLVACHRVPSTSGPSLGDPSNDDGSNDAPATLAPTVVLGGANGVVAEDSVLELTLLAGVADLALTIAVTTPPVHGALDVTSGTAPLVVRYTPAADYAGEDHFVFTVSDAAGVVAEQTAVLYVAAVNDPPVAANDGPFAASGPVTIAVLENDSDKDDARLFVSIVTPPATGTASVDADQAITFVPAQAGNVSIGYRVTDAAGATSDATLSITASAALGISSFIATPPAALAGAPLTLAWTSTGATACSVSSPSGEIASGTSGNVQVTASGVTVYVLRCSRGGFSVTRALATSELSDFDGDGLADADELTTSGALADTDGDRLCDGAIVVGSCVGSEVVFGTSPLVADADNDGLTDGAELLDGTSPVDADSDDDGLRDGQEDANDDGALQNGETDPADPDTNDDGLCDGLRADNDGNGLTPASACLAPVVLVDASAPTGGDGHSWATAMRSVQAGVDAATAGQSVYVAAGEYKADADGAPVLTLTNGARVYGGFLGTETALADRPSPLAETILSGDRDGSDGCSVGDSVHVVVSGSGSLLDGFTVERGCGGPTGAAYENSGAGIYHLLGSVTLANVVVRKNKIASSVQTNLGAGLYAAPGTTLSITNAVFSENEAAQSATSGGGIALRGATGTLSRLVLERNLAVDHYGGGLYCAESGTVSVTDSTFAFNAAGEEGGAAYVFPCAGSYSNLAFIANDGATSVQLFSAAQPSPIDRLAIVANHGGAFFGSNVVGQPLVSNLSVHGNTGGMLHLINAVARDISVTANDFQRAIFLGQAASIVNGTVAQNVLSKSAVETQGAASGSVSNVVLYGNVGPSGDFAKGVSTVSVAHSCSQQDLGSFGVGNATLVLSPFTAAFASQHLYLHPQAGDPGCIDRGDDAIATSAGSPWSTLSAYASGVLDQDSGDGLSVGSDVDAGRHYHPLAVRVPAFSANASDASWTTEHATSCRLFNSAAAGSVSLADATLTVGSLPHGQANGVVLVLVCFGNHGEPAIARATIP